MINLGLSNSDELKLFSALTDSHAIRITILILDKDEKVVDRLTGENSRLVDGSIQIDSGADVTRSCSLTLFDPDQKLQFDGTSPAEGTLFADRMVGVLYGVWVASLGRYVDIPVFSGPLVSFHRQGALVNVEALGKESLALAPHYPFKTFNIPKGTKLDDAIRKVMDSIGETKYLLPSIETRMPVDRAVLQDSELWKVITESSDGIVKKKRRVKSHGKTQTVIDKKREPVPSILNYSKVPSFAFYNGAGQLVVRSTNTSSVFNFQEGIHLIDRPDFQYDVSYFRNHVVVRGSETKGRRKNKQGQRVEFTTPAPIAAISLPGTHPLAPKNIGRNGTGRYLIELVDAPSLKKKADVIDRANQVLKNVSTEGLSVSFNCLPIPMLEEGDMVTIYTETAKIDFRIGQMTIPLTASSPMSVGMNTKVTDIKGRNR